MIVLRQKMNYKKHYMHYTGEYILAHDNKAIKNNIRT